MSLSIYISKVPSTVFKFCKDRMTLESERSQSSAIWDNPIDKNKINMVRFLISPPKCMNPKEFTAMSSSY